MYNLIEMVHCFLKEEAHPTDKMSGFTQSDPSTALQTESNLQKCNSASLSSVIPGADWHTDEEIKVRKLVMK
jgi:hypothetical protein